MQEITTSTTTIPAAQRLVLDVVDRPGGAGGNDRVGRVDHLAELGWEGQERDEPVPGAFPHGQGGAVLAAQRGVGLLEQGSLGGVGVGRGVDGFEGGGELLAVGVGGIAQ